jgi:hypothetical protein
METKEIKLTIPNQVEDIRLGQYQEYFKLVKGLDSDAVFTEFMKMKVVSIFCDVPIDLVREGFKSSVVDDISTRVITLIGELSDDVEGFKPTFKLGETTFGFINNFEDMNAGEFADLTQYFADFDDMHRAMAVMYRPVVKTEKNKLLKLQQYDIEKYNGTTRYSELMKSMPAIKALEASFFLTNSFIKLRHCFLTYIKNHPKVDNKTSTALNQFLIANGDGIKPFTV